MGRAAPVEPTTVAGELLRLTRRQSGLTQRQLATLAGVPQPMIAAYETGRREPSMPTLLKLINAAGLDLRLQLVALADHDQVLAKIRQEWPDDKREQWDRYQQWIMARNRVAL
ncbi:MAG: helix-turn-helix domain-containing protein [Actinomycetota bacterium]|nr:helix-turn-helix domain-containing protein [Actinomycetota bacterium]